VTAQDVAPVLGHESGTVLGVVSEVWRYPVKSMQGEHLQAIDVDAVGFVGDRRFAVRDEATRRLLHGRTTPALLQASARLVGGEPVITLPGGEQLRGLGEVTDASLSMWLGRPVCLVASHGASAETAPAIEIPTNGTFAAWTEESLRSMPLHGALARMRAQPARNSANPLSLDDAVPAPPPSHVLLLPSLPGTFNDCEAVHLVSDAELGAGHDDLPEANWDRRRFRPNLLVHDAAGASDALEWVGSQVSIGSVELAVTEPTLRCGMTTADQPGLDKDPRILGALARRRGAYLGRYARVVRPGTIRAGDPIVYTTRGATVDLQLYRFYRDRIRG